MIIANNKEDAMKQAQAMADIEVAGIISEEATDDENKTAYTFEGSLI